MSTKELTLNERYILAKHSNDFVNCWNDRQEFDDMEIPRLRGELTEEQIKILNQNNND